MSYKKEIQEIISLLKEKYTDDKGLIIQPSGQGELIHLINDLGDYLPFLRYVNENELADLQIQLMPKYFSKGLLDARQKFLFLKFLTPYEHSDLILGLLDCGHLDKAKSLLKEVMKKFQMLELASSFYFPLLKLQLPIFDTIDGMYVELLTSYYKLTKDKIFLEHAEVLADKLINLEFFRKHGLFPELINRSAWNFYPKTVSKRFKSIKLMKNNTNTLFGILELYKFKPKEELKSAIHHWVSSLRNNMRNEKGGVYGEATISDGKIKAKNIDLTSNFAVIDFLCDAFFILKDESYLQFAKEIADFWLQRQGRTGLMPLYPGKSDQYSYLDSETDMIVALKKLAELSGNDKYEKSANEILQGILKFHKGPNGYYLEVDIKDGKIIDDFIKVKFNCLFLKVLILYDEREKGIYSNPQLFELLKDR